MLTLADLLLPPRPRMRWWWSPHRRELERARYVREWQAAMWDQTQGMPVRLAAITRGDEERRTR
jgi:hypothetical protein